MRMNQPHISAAKLASAILTLLAMATLFVANASAAAAPSAGKNAVDKAIKRAAAKGQITSEQKSIYLGDWKAALQAPKVLRRRGKDARAKVVESVISNTIAIARRKQLTGQRIEACISNLNATVYVMSKRPYPADKQKISIPDDPAVYAYYSGEGVQIQPLFTFTKANLYYSAGQAEGFIAIVDRMKELTVNDAGYNRWEYYFDWQGGSPPWVSAMTQATGMQVFARASEVSEDPSYLEVAKGALAGFEKSAATGGLSVNETGGKWFLIYPFNRDQRILNGHLQALIGLHDYYEISQDTQALQLRDWGVETALATMSWFDTGAWSRYDRESEADVGYHDLMTNQLKKLAGKTDIADFKQWSDRFAAYRVTPPTATIPDQEIKPVYPVEDGFLDAVKVKYFVDKKSKITVRIIDTEGDSVRALSDSGSRGFHTFEWDGRDHAKKAVAPGIYTIEFTLTDIVGNRGTVQGDRNIEIKVDSTPPTINSSQALAVDKKRSRIIVDVTDEESGWVIASIKQNDVKLASKKGKGRFSFVVSKPLSQIRNSTLVVTDSSGNFTEAVFS